MADPLGSLEKIVKLALRIKEAVDTVRQNKEECQQIRTRAVRVSSLLSRLPETGMTADPAMCGALEDLEDSLRRAHTLVAACQETTTVCIYCTAGRQARRLRRVQDDISQKVMLVVFATNIQTTIILTNIRTGEAGPPEQAAGEITETPVVDPCNLSTGGPLQSSAIMKSGLSSLPRRMSLNANGGSEEEVETNNNVPTRSKVPSASGLLDGMEHSQAAQPLTSPSLTTATWDEPDSPIDRLAVREDTHSLSTSDFCKKLAVREGLKKFGLSELEAATHHFSVENMVGSGAFATVYKGVLQDGLVVAIKKFRYPNVLSAEHIDELHIVSKFKHKNIVKLIGYGSDVLEGGEQCEDAKVRDKEDKQTSFLFVEEYMPNGSLDKIINGLQVDWSSRFLLILGIARGLRYLHKRNIVHLDVKPSNILLDYDMNPKITDFGMTRVLNHKGVDIYSDIGTIAGTLGYMPPEYITDGTLSKKHDVYSFGVTLLDIISSMSRFKRISNQSSIEWAWEVRQAGRTMELLDPSLFDVSQLKEIQKCVEVGLLCTQFNPAHRPGMRTALKMLRGEKALRIPVRPGYTKEPAASCFGGWSCLRVRL